jgi:hypothetical protein
MTDQPHGLARGLTNYGDADVSLHLRPSFAKSMGYSRAMLARPRGLIGDGSPAGPANIVEMAADLPGDVEVTEGERLPPKDPGLLS